MSRAGAPLARLAADRMMSSPIKVLLIEDDPDDVVLIREMIEEASSVRFDLVHAERLEEGLALLAEDDFDGIILDLSLPDSQGIATFTRVAHGAPRVPVLVLTGLSDEAVASEAVRLGAQDYLIKGEVNSDILVRTFRLSLERKHAEEALRESEARFRDFADAASDWLWEMDEHFRLTFVSERVRELVGFSPEEATGKTRWELCGIDPADDPHWLRHKADLEGHRPFRDFRYSFVNPAGRVHHVKLSGKPVFDGNGAFCGYRGTGTDETAEIESRRRAREAESLLRGITGNLPGIIFRRVLRADGSVYCPFTSPRAHELVGCDREVLAQRPGLIFEAVHPDDAAHLANALDASGGDLSPLSLEYRIVTPDGQTKWVQCGAQPRRLETGEVVWDGLLLDISERKRLETQLLQAQKLESIGQLAAGIAHEINTPAQYVGDNVRFLEDAFADLLELERSHCRLLAAARAGEPCGERVAETERIRDEVDVDYLEGEIPKAIAQALEGVARIAKIVRAMKDFSHPGAEDKEPVDVNRVIENTVTVSRNEWKYVAELVTELDPALPTVEGYAAELGQALLNLIVNAAHAIAEVVGDGGDGKGCITIRTRAAHGAVEIRVADTGPGIPEAIRDRVFDPFFTTKDVGKGTGQGLAIARSVVVDKHGGSLELESEPGAGTTFIVRLPLEAPASAGQGLAA